MRGPAFSPAAEAQLEVPAPAGKESRAGAGTRVTTAPAFSLVSASIATLGAPAYLGPVAAFARFGSGVLSPARKSLPMSTAGPPAREGEPSSALILVLAFATGALVANLYYAQPLIAAIASDLGLQPGMAGAVASVTQIGYGVGLFLIVSLADLVESRRLALATLGLTAIGLVGAALSTSATPFFIAAAMIGLFSSGAQVLLSLIHISEPTRPY